MKPSANKPDSVESRRQFLIATAKTGITAAITGGYWPAALANPVTQIRLQAAPDRLRLVPEPYNETNVWCYNRSVPGPEIRVRNGDRLNVVFKNGLDE
jgi:FtsP/CotA-like multicopper oxidase with cupredoxin domain